MSPPSKDAKERQDPEELGYADAMAELEAILEELEGDDLDVDVLAERVRRASTLIKVCRTRITRASADVERIVADLDDFADDERPDGDDADGAEDEAEPDD